MRLSGVFGALKFVLKVLCVWLRAVALMNFHSFCNGVLPEHIGSLSRYA
jgi:hypothetical protein